LAALYVRRFSTEFKVAFDAWVKTKPLSNPTAPPGPSFMPEYRNPQILQGVAANREASRIFDEGTAARKHSEEYTGTTVVLATVLFLVALSPRFQSRRVRFALLLLTGGLAVYALATILTSLGYKDCPVIPAEAVVGSTKLWRHATVQSWAAQRPRKGSPPTPP
jgi:hypothetical protein